MFKDNPTQASVGSIKIFFAVLLDGISIPEQGLIQTQERRMRAGGSALFFNDIDNGLKNTPRFHACGFIGCQEIIHIKLFEKISKIFLTHGNDHGGVFAAHMPDHVTHGLLLL